MRLRTKRHLIHANPLNKAGVLFLLADLTTNVYAEY
jgi:hypothetical protein